MIVHSHGDDVGSAQVVYTACTDRGGLNIQEDMYNTTLANEILNFMFDKYFIE